mmetsp:Transcript_82390/g.266845  ORF Transcript_82390/g.266845 Transcript_82390/m.266845 type:complete len:201 (-) Transcript_82390:68-670(-)
MRSAKKLPSPFRRSAAAETSHEPTKEGVLSKRSPKSSPWIAFRENTRRARRPDPWTPPMPSNSFSERDTASTSADAGSKSTAAAARKWCATRPVRKGSRCQDVSRCSAKACGSELQAAAEAAPALPQTNTVSKRLCNQIKYHPSGVLTSLQWPLQSFIRRSNRTPLDRTPPVARDSTAFRRLNTEASDACRRTTQRGSGK